MIKHRYFFMALVSLLLTAGLIQGLAQRRTPQVLQTNLENLPMEISGFQGRDDFFPQSVYDALPADRHVYRHYQAPAGEQLSMYIGYYGTAKGGRTGHNPYACLPGAGWTIVERGEVELRPSFQPRGVKVNYVLAKKDGVANVMLHWYQSAGTRVFSSGLQQNIDRFVGRVLHNRNDGAFVQVYSFAGEHEISPVQQRVQEFALQVLELLPGVWPIEG